MPKFESYAQGTPCYVELTTTDLPAAKAFYSALFGWTFEAPPGHEDVYASARVAGDRVAGLGVPSPETPQLGWAVYLAVDDVDAAAAKVESAGGKVELAPTDVMTLGRMTTITDPTGVRVHLWQAGAIPGTERANEPGAPIWNELVTPELERATAFYAEVLGVTWEDAGMVGDQPYALLKVGDRPVGGALPATGGAPPHWNVYFNVADVDTTLVRAEDHGGKVAAPAFDVPDVGRMAYLADPGGATFAVMSSA